MTDRLFIPHGAKPAGIKNRDGLYIGAVVIVTNTGQGATREDGTEEPLTALVTFVYPDDEKTSDRFGRKNTWPGQRPFIDCMAITPDQKGDRGEPVGIRKVPWVEDVNRIMALQGMPKTRPFPGYRVVSRMEGIR